MSEPLMTCKDVATLFRLLPVTISRRCKAGTMQPPPVLTRPYRFSPVQVRQVLAGEWRTPPSGKTFFARGKAARARLTLARG